jgi:hypothetical protein
MCKDKIHIFRAIYSQTRECPEEIKALVHYIDIKYVDIVIIIIIIIIINVVSYHRPFLPGTSLETAVIPTAQASKLHTAVLSVLCVMFQV